MIEDFLSIFNVPLHKLNLQRVALLSREKNRSGRRYYRFIGLFEFVPPEFVWEDDVWSELFDNRREIISKFNCIEEQSVKSIKRKFTKKLRSGGDIKKIDFEYVFDIIPRRLVEFSFDADRKKMHLYILGYGM